MFWWCLSTLPFRHDSKPHVDSNVILFLSYFLQKSVDLDNYPPSSTLILMMLNFFFYNFFTKNSNLDICGRLSGPGKNHNFLVFESKIVIIDVKPLMDLLSKILK